MIIFKQLFVFTHQYRVNVETTVYRRKVDEVLSTHLWVGLTRGVEEMQHVLGQFKITVSLSL